MKLVQVTMSSSDIGAGLTGSFNTNQARVDILLKSKSGAEQAAERLKQKLEELYGSGSSQLNVVQPGPTASQYLASAKGRDPAALRKASDMLVEELSKDSELTNVKSDLAAESLSSWSRWTAPRLRLEDSVRNSWRFRSPVRCPSAGGEAGGGRAYGLHPA